jgi:hypothetical protein
MRHFLNILALTIVTIMTVVVVWFVHAFLTHEFHIPLHAYVSREIEPAALKFEAGDYPGSLQIINSQKPQSHRPMIELHYVKALCLQASKQFRQSAEEYSYIRQHTADEDLTWRAAVGDFFANVHQPFVIDQQTHFPDYAPTIDLIQIAP